jgi:DNA-3-methyladenine glycosylase I
MILQRCAWVSSDDPFYATYHDLEWGVPVHDDRVLFEFILLEGAQAGLSWSTVLRKRENYRAAFANFDPKIVSEFGEQEIGQLLANPGIIRNRLKIKSAINNARLVMAIQQEFGSLNNYFWQWVGFKPIVNRWLSVSEIPARTPLSDKISKDMKQRGFTFFGSTICYAHMQATGMVNDHTMDCFRYNELVSR